MKILIFSVPILTISITAFGQVSLFMNNTKKVDSLLQSVYADDLPGVSVAIVHDGKVILKKSYGVREIDSKEKISSSTNFNIASLTKQFTAMAILQLAEKNKLSLSDKLSHFFPKMNPKLADAITVKELLTHTSGIPDHYDYTNTKNMHHAHDRDVLDAIKNTDSTYFTPGTKFRYSNTAFCILALIIEKTSGLSYHEYLEKNIFLPSGMKHSTVWNEQASIRQPAIGYELDSMQKKFRKSQAEENVFFSTEGDGGIYTSVNDYLKWFKALQSGKVFPKKITDEARSIQFAIDKNKRPGYGYGWFIDNNDIWKKVYHSGSNGGFRSFSFTIPSQNILIVIFSNRADIDLEEVVLKIIHLVMPVNKPFAKIEKLTS
jgi:D-alanyl-D-alanine carboxypeptidase